MHSDSVCACSRGLTENRYAASADGDAEHVPQPRVIPDE